MSTPTWSLGLVNRRIACLVFAAVASACDGQQTVTTQLTNAIDARNQTNQYSYNDDDSLQGISYPNAVLATQPVSFIYDAKYARLKSRSDGAGQFANVTQYTYNSVPNAIPSPATAGNGFLATETAAYPAYQVSYQYDALGRVSQRQIDGDTVSWAFDDLGRPSSVVNDLDTFTIGYHTFGSSPRADSVTFALNGANRSIQFTYANGGGQDQGRLQTINNLLGASGVSVSRHDYSYDAIGRVADWTRQPDNTPGADTFYQYRYDPVGQLRTAILGNGTPASPGASIQTNVYTYDTNGNRTVDGFANGNITNVHSFAFNNLNELTNRYVGGKQTIFIGTAIPKGSATLSSVTLNGEPATLSGNNFQAVLGYTGKSKVVTAVALDSQGRQTTKIYTMTDAGTPTSASYTYDANGNPISSVSGATNTLYEWDAADRLVAITKCLNAVPQARTEVSYDGLGRRVRIVEKDSTLQAISDKRFVWAGLELCEERDPANNRLEQYFPQGFRTNGVNYYYTRDHLGSIREVLDNTGAVLTRYDYDPYGTRTNVSGTLNADFGFGGYYYHQPTSLQLAPYRGYDSSAGRWLNRDPMGERFDRNPYRFTYNSPVNFVDPNGLWGIAFGNNSGSSYFNFGIGNPSLYFSPDSVTGVGQSAAATADGINPFGDPFAHHGFYDPNDPYNRFSHGAGKVAQVCLTSAAGLGALKAANAAFMPQTLYHFTSLQGAAGIAATGGIEAGSGLYGTGVYLTGFNSAALATIQGAASTEAVVAVSTEGLTVTATYFPGTYIVQGASVLVP